MCEYRQAMPEIILHGIIALFQTALVLLIEDEQLRQNSQLKRKKFLGSAQEYEDDQCKLLKVGANKLLGLRKVIVDGLFG